MKEPSTAPPSRTPPPRLARACRRGMRGAVLVTLLGAPFILPVIVAILGLLAVFGHNGLIHAELFDIDCGASIGVVIFIDEARYGIIVGI